MEIGNIIAFVIVGIIAGWLASFVVGGSGLVTYLIMGIVGAFAGPLLLRVTGLKFDIGGPLVTSILVSAIGAIVVVFVVGLFI